MRVYESQVDYYHLKTILYTKPQRNVKMDSNPAFSRHSSYKENIGRLSTIPSPHPFWTTTPSFVGIVESAVVCCRTREKN